MGQIRLATNMSNLYVPAGEGEFLDQLVYCWIS